MRYYLFRVLTELLSARMIFRFHWVLPAIVASQCRSGKRKSIESSIGKGLAAGLHIVQPATAVDEYKAAIKAGYTFIAVAPIIYLCVMVSRNLYSDIQKLKV